MSGDLHLWEHDHPYYCTEGCYYASRARDQICHAEVVSWHEFMTGDGGGDGSWGESDEDYNMLMRWDWAHGAEQFVDEDPDRHELRLYFYQQRKARPFSVYISVTADDEPAIREWLARRWEHTRKLWAPFSGWVRP